MPITNLGEIQRELQGYAEVPTFEALKELKGKKLRYTISEYKGPNNAGPPNFYRGGVLSVVDEGGRFIMLLNVVSKQTWSIQLQKMRDGVPVVASWERNKRSWKPPAGKWFKLTLFSESHADDDPDCAKVKEKLYQLFLKGELKVPQGSGSRAPTPPRPKGKQKEDFTNGRAH